mgnify:CR=1 FL=1
MSNKFRLYKNSYLNIETLGYYHQFYTGYQKPNNPDFLNVLKNTYDDEDYSNLIIAKQKVENILRKDIHQILEENGWEKCVITGVPRSKSYDSYSENQLMFKRAIADFAKETNNIFDGTDYIIRQENTKTTHIRKPVNYNNDGEMPYPGITAKTCCIDGKMIKNKKIILVDDIYTKYINIDEDCIQALYSSGAEKVILYVIGYTKKD